MAWIFEDKFNSDTKSVNPLNTQDNWAGDVNFLVNTDADSRYEGDQGVKITTDGNSRIIRQNMGSTVSDGTMYAAIRTNTADTNCPYIYLVKDGDTAGCFVGMRNDGKMTYYNSAWTRYDIDGGFTFAANTWYPIGISFRSSDTKYIAGVYRNSAWQWGTNGAATPGAGITWVTPPNNGGAYKDILLGIAPEDNGEVVYFDTITPIDPTGAPPTTIKTIGDIVVATVKTWNDIAFANVKTINDIA